MQHKAFEPCKKGRGEVHVKLRFRVPDKLNVPRDVFPIRLGDSERISMIFFLLPSRRKTLILGLIFWLIVFPSPKRRGKQKSFESKKVVY